MGTKQEVSKYLAILLQIVMMSCGTHLVKKHESQSRTIGSFGNHTVNPKTDSKTLYYSLLKLTYTPSIVKHNKD